MNYRNEQYLQEDLQRLRGLRLIDDDFMTACFDNYIEGAQLLLNIILDRTDLTVTEVRAQRVLKSLQGRDVWLDIFALDAQGIRYNVEIQRADKGADRKRARYHSSMMDADQLKPGEDYSDLGESYVIFITENDVIGMNKPIYRIERQIKECDCLPFNDGEHIIYVIDKVRYFKETEEGLGLYYKVLELFKPKDLFHSYEQNRF